MTQENIKKAKYLADMQYYPALETGDFDDCVYFVHNGQMIVHPWMDLSGRYELTMEQAIALYGNDTFEDFCRRILREDSAKKVQGYNRMYADQHPQSW